MKIKKGQTIEFLQNKGLASLEYRATLFVEDEDEEYVTFKVMRGNQHYLHFRKIGDTIKVKKDKLDRTKLKITKSSNHPLTNIFK